GTSSSSAWPSPTATTPRMRSAFTSAETRSTVEIVTGPLLGVVVAALVFGLATAFGVFRRIRDGRPVPVDAPVDAAAYPLDRLGVDPDAAVTLLQFSSAF